MTQKKKNTQTRQQILTNQQTESSRRIPVIGIGASAGGLEALKQFFSKVNAESDMAYVVVIHLTPEHPSMMAEILGKVSAIPVEQAKDGQSVEPNHAYIVPPNKNITIYKGKLQFLEMKNKLESLPIDIFFRSLSQDQEDNAAAIVLSGTGTDGTQGVREIKSNEGLVFAQTEETAEYFAMPKSAIDTGLVDLKLAPGEMPAKLHQYFTKTKKKKQQKQPEQENEDKTNWLEKIFSILRNELGYDFSTYKTNTIIRRIDRRMSLYQMEDYHTYADYLHEEPTEAEALFRELLIGVTSFFRDPDSFRALKKEGLPKLINSLKDNSNLRVWVPGCSTGEEVYSLTILVHEYLKEHKRSLNLKIFGTDIDKYAIDKAREGLFPATIASDVTKERLEKYFTKEGSHYKITEEIRDNVIFSVQNILKDPPFSNLNMLCCRNLLIYFNSESQKKLLPLFHYTLKPGGILMLGSSETIGSFINHFKPINKKWKIFQRLELSSAMNYRVDFPSEPVSQEEEAKPQALVKKTERSTLENFTKDIVLKKFAPAAVLIDSEGTIMHIQGRVGKYLEHPSGPPTYNIFDQAREGLRLELTSAFREAKKEDKRITHYHIQVKTDGETEIINLHIAPEKYNSKSGKVYLVVFEHTAISDLHYSKHSKQDEQQSEEPSKMEELERELQFTRENYQTTVEELESSNEELKTTNEELQSSNEELQSTNEELESSKEELQSLNEELQTVNAELQNKVEELSTARDDMYNLLNSRDIATIFVDNELKVRRFTPEATTIVNLIQTDIGRPLEHVLHNLTYDHMIGDLEHVLNKLQPKEKEVQTKHGNWYSMRITPYRTTDNRIDGAVLTFVSIDEQKEVQQKLFELLTERENVLELVRSVFDMSDDPMLVLDKKGKIVIANTAFTELMNEEQTNIEGKDVFSVYEGVFKKTGLASLLQRALKMNEDFINKKITIKVGEVERKYSIHGLIIKKKEDYPYRLLLRFVS